MLRLHFILRCQSSRPSRSSHSTAGQASSGTRHPGLFSIGPPGLTRLSCYFEASPMASPPTTATPTSRSSSNQQTASTHSRQLGHFPRPSVLQTPFGDPSLSGSCSPIRISARTSRPAS